MSALAIRTSFQGGDGVTSQCNFGRLPVPREETWISRLEDDVREILPKGRRGRIDEKSLVEGCFGTRQVASEDEVAREFVGGLYDAANHLVDDSHRECPGEVTRGIPGERLSTDQPECLSAKVARLTRGPRGRLLDEPLKVLPVAVDIDEAVTGLSCGRGEVSHSDVLARVGHVIPHRRTLDVDGAVVGDRPQCRLYLVERDWPLVVECQVRDDGTNGFTRTREGGGDDQWSQHVDGQTRRRRFFWGHGWRLGCWFRRDYRPGGGGSSSCRIRTLNGYLINVRGRTGPAGPWLVVRLRPSWLWTRAEVRPSSTRFDRGVDDDAAKQQGQHHVEGRTGSVIKTSSHWGSRFSDRRCQLRWERNGYPRGSTDIDHARVHARCVLILGADGTTWRDHDRSASIRDRHGEVVRRVDQSILGTHRVGLIDGIDPDRAVSFARSGEVRNGRRGYRGDVREVVPPIGIGDGPVDWRRGPLDREVNLSLWSLHAAAVRIRSSESRRRDEHDARPRDVGTGTGDSNLETLRDLIGHRVLGHTRTGHCNPGRCGDEE